MTEPERSVPRESLEAYNARQNALALAAWNKRVPPLPEILDMPHISQMLQSKYLVQQDVPSPVRVTIRAVVPENQRSRDGHGAETKWIVYFHQSAKGLKLNATMIKVLAAAFGETSEAWIGKAVRLYRDPTVEFGGRVVGGLRLQTPRTAATEHEQRFTAGAFAPGAFERQASGSVAPPAGAAFDRETGEIRTAPAAAAAAAAAPAEAEFDDDIPF